MLMGFVAALASTTGARVAYVTRAHSVRQLWLHEDGEATLVATTGPGDDVERIAADRCDPATPLWWRRAGASVWERVAPGGEVTPDDVPAGFELAACGGFRVAWLEGETPHPASQVQVWGPDGTVEVVSTPGRVGSPTLGLTPDGGPFVVYRDATGHCAAVHAVVGGE